MMKINNFFPLACFMATINLNDFNVQCADLLETFKSDLPSDLSLNTNQCLQFKCTTDDRLDGMDLCYKADHLQENFGIVHLKRCRDGKMCHGKLNRCMYDPYNLFESKLPGQTCEYNY